MLLEEEDQHFFSLYRQLLCVLGRSGGLSHDDPTVSLEEFTTIVINIPGRHSESGRSTEVIDDVVVYFLTDYCLMSRRQMSCILNMCCLPHYRPQLDYLLLILT